MFSKVVQKKLKINPANFKHARIHNLFTGLKKRRIVCIRDEFRVTRPDLGIFTNVDGIGVIGDSVVVVIELKNTQYTTEQHLEVYDKPCMNRRKLTKDLLNTERNAHALQTGFGMNALQRVLPKNTSVTGLVIVCTADGAKMYDVDSSFADDKHFHIPTIKPATGSYMKLVSFQPIPKTATALEHIKAALSKFGYRFLKSMVLTSFNTKYGSFTMSLGDKSYLVVALVHSVGKPGEAKRRQLANDINKLWIDKKRKVKVRGCMLVFSAGPKPFHTVEFTPKTYLPRDSL